MLAKLSDKSFDSNDWLFEIKWDGYRAIAEVNGKQTKLYSRNGLDFSKEYNAVYEALCTISAKVIVDGEIVALNKEGKPDFQALQMHAAQPSYIVYQIFDLLSLNGKDVTHLPLTERKKILKDALPKNELLKYADHLENNGKDFFELVCSQNLEGIIAKRKKSVYAKGKRNGDWLKIKNHFVEEAVIAGYTAPRNSRKYFGALVLGAYKNKQLKYIGHTGTGFSDNLLEALFKKMQPLITDKNPFHEKIKVNAPATWLNPLLVANIKFSERTNAGILRHPVFEGLRIDKTPKEVTIMNEEKSTPLKKISAQKNTRSFGLITHPDKIYWPDEGITKGEMIDYYNAVYKYIIPYLKDRPQSLNRFPNGIKGASFYQKDAGENAPDFVTTFPVWSESTYKTVDYLVCNNQKTLQYIANLGCIEINPWNSKTKTPDKPDYLILDLDPSEKNTFDEVIDCALVIKELFDEIKIKSYCKTSGASGIHIFVPLQAKYDYEHARMFAELISRHVVARLPDTTTLERSLSKRKKNHIYVDYLQNKQGATLSAAYSLRPKPHAPVSTPLDWKELKHGLLPADFNIHNIMKRLARKGDIFSPVLKRGINMEKALQLLGEK